MAVIRLRASAVLVFTLSLLALLVSSSSAQEAKGVRRIEIPHRAGFYGSLESRVITSQKQLEDLLKTFEKRAGGGDFVEAIQKAKVALSSSEVLVLIRHEEGSGSIQVTFAPTEANGNKLVCKIQRKVPAFQTLDFAHYCLALAIPLFQFTEVEVIVDGKQREVL